MDSGSVEINKHSYRADRTEFKLGSVVARVFTLGMPRYFFHIRHADGTLVPDDEGAEFEDRLMARHEGIDSIRDLVADAVKYGREANSLALEIVDEAGKVIETISARQVFDA